MRTGGRGVVSALAADGVWPIIYAALTPVRC